jgi:PAS domain S-box-containing protein
MMIDITSQLKTQQDLDEKTNLIRGITEAVPDIIHVFDLRTGKTVYNNRLLLIDLGYSEEEAEHHRGNVVSLLHPDDQHKLKDLATFLKDVPDGQIITSDYRIKNKHGEWRWMLTVNTIFKRDDKNNPIQILGTSRDITDQKHASDALKVQNEKLHELTEELRRKVMQLEEFAQIVSHNLRSPVGNISTLLEFFEQSSDEKEKQEYFSLLKEASRDTFLTLTELNEVLRIKQEYYLKRQDLSFEKVLKHVEHQLGAQIIESGLEINTNFEVPNISYPEIYLESILLNFISNSIKYRHRQRKPTVFIRTYRKGNSVMMEVSDNGLGIDMDRYSHQLFRMRKTFHGHPEARGVGLFITKNQVESMGGEIAANGKINEGMTFIVNFSKT